MNQEVIENIDDDDYPLWLGDSIIQDKLPWEQGLNISFKEFSKKYTLHDSGWIGLFYNVRNKTSVTLVIDWDTFWLPDNITLKQGRVFLLIKIKKVVEVSTPRDFDDDNPHCCILSYEIESIDEQQLFIISSCMDGDVEITFLGDMSFLALDENKSVLAI